MPDDTSTSVDWDTYEPTPDTTYGSDDSTAVGGTDEEFVDDDGAAFDPRTPTRADDGPDPRRDRRGGGGAPREPTPDPDPVEVRGPTAEERAETIGGETVERAAEQLDDQRPGVTVEPQDVELDRSGETVTARPTGAAADEIQDLRREGLERQTRDLPEERAFGGITEPEADVRTQDETLDVLGPPTAPEPEPAPTATPTQQTVERGQAPVPDELQGPATAQDISPSARMSLDDPEAIQARAQKEQDILGWQNIEEPGDVPAAAAGGLFEAGQGIERFSTTVGGAISEGGGVDAGPTVGEESVGEVPANLVGGSVSFLGMGVGAGLQLPASFAYDVNTAQEGGETPTAVQGGAGETVETFGETQVEMAQDYPVSTGLGFVSPGAQAVPAGVRGFRATRGTGGRRVALEDITTERGTSGETPQFDTATDAPTRDAVSEIETRMGDQPDVITEQTAGDGGVLFHTTQADFGRRVTVGEGASELPGLFTSPEASPLGLNRLGSSSETSPRFGLGDYSLQEGRAPGFEPRSVEGMPARAGESGYAVRDPQGNVVETGLSRGDANAMADRIGGERVPDPTTRGYEFLTEDAPTETGLVRPRGDRTPEMETVLAPDSEFVQTGAVGVEMPGGRVIRSDIFRPAGEPARGGRVGDAGTGVEAPTRTASEITRSASRPARQPDITAETTFGTSGSAGSGTTSVFGSEVAGGEPVGTAETTTRIDEDETRLDSDVFRGSEIGRSPFGEVRPTSEPSSPRGDARESSAPPLFTSEPSSPTVSRAESVAPSTMSPSDPTAVPVPMGAQSERATRSRDTDERAGGDPEPLPDDEPPAATVGFTNPIASVFDGEALGPFG